MFDAQCVSQVTIVANQLGIPPEALLAIAEVESGGRVFAKVDGKREPLIRFEGHYFDRLLRGEQRLRARRAALAHPKAGKIRNPRSQQKRWELLNRAIAVNRIAALSSTSWGVGQVMGAHWQWLGYDSVEQLVSKARSGAAGQIGLMARYIDRAGLVPAVATRDWKAFARGYNGPSYARNTYDKKIDAAYRRLMRTRSGPVLRSQQSGSPAPGEREEKTKIGRTGAKSAPVISKIRKAIRDGLLLISRRIL